MKHNVSKMGAVQGELITCINIEPLKNNSIAPDLELNKEYSVKELFTCKCGEKHVNIGLPLNVNFVECYKCRETLPKTNHWCHSSRFERNGLLPLKDGDVIPSYQINPDDEDF